MLAKPNIFNMYHEVAFYCLLIMCSLVGISRGEDIVVSATPRTPHILSGQPLVVDVEVTNHAAEPVTIDIGPHGIAAFWFTLYDAQGGTIATSEQILEAGTSSAIQRFTLMPVEKKSVPLVMNRWCSTKLSPGEYAIRISWDTFEWLDGDTKISGHDTFELAVSASDDATLAEHFNDLKNDALHSQSPTRELSRRLLFSESVPAAVEAISSYVAMQVEIRARHQLDIGDAIGALGQIETIESVEALTDILNIQNLADTTFEHTLRNLYRIKDKAENAEVRNASASILQKRPRPPPAGSRIN